MLVRSYSRYSRVTSLVDRHGDVGERARGGQSRRAARARGSGRSAGNRPRSSGCPTRPAGARPRPAPPRRAARPRGRGRRSGRARRAVAASHQARRLLIAEVVHVRRRHVAAPDLEDVAEPALVMMPVAAPLRSMHRVQAERRAVDEDLRLGQRRAELGQRVEHTLRGTLRRRRCLLETNRLGPAVELQGVHERAADVDGDAVRFHDGSRRTVRPPCMTKKMWRSAAMSSSGLSRTATKSATYPARSRQPPRPGR